MELIKIYRTATGGDGAMMFDTGDGSMSRCIGADNNGAGTLRMASRHAKKRDGGQHKTLQDARGDCEDVLTRGIFNRAGTVVFPRWSANTRRTQTAVLVPRKAGGSWCYMEKRENMRGRGNNAVALTEEQTKVERARIAAALLEWRRAYAGMCDYFRYSRPRLILAD